MLERMDMEKETIENPKIEKLEISDPELRLIDEVIRDFAPEVSYLYHFREDEAEEQQVKTGLLHENRILGILLKFYLNGQEKVSTTDVEEEYERYFKEVARSTISTYLNILKKESTLYKERDGRIVYYIFSEKPPIGISSFWFLRIFCIVPVYFTRARFFCELYLDAEKYIQQYIKDSKIKDQEIDILIQNFKLITGLIILNIFRNRSSKCMLCQFCKREYYQKLEDIINTAIKERSDVLSEEVFTNFIEKCSEIQIFDGIDINENGIKEKILEEIIRNADRYKKDLEFQRMLSFRRQDLSLKRKRGLEENFLFLFVEEKKIEKGV
ncbi:MAG: hypothetical protein ACFE91_01360 [Promethearchaeota archaeon]